MSEIKVTEILACLSSVVIALGIVLLVVLFGKRIGLIEILKYPAYVYCVDK